MNDSTIQQAQKSVVIAVDIGTTGTKVLAVNAQGHILASHNIGYELHTPKPGYAEQNPIEILHAVIQGVKVVVEKALLNHEDVLCVSFSSAMHSLIAVDRHLQPLTACITWADQRGTSFADQLKQDGAGLAIYHATGTPIHPMSPLIKLMWMREHESELLHTTYQFLGIKEFILARFFGQCVIDYSLASTTGLFNIRNLEWDKDALELAGVRAEQLPRPVPTTFQLRGLGSSYATAMGLSMETPFVVGASDGVLANLGAGALEPGVTAVTIGTSGAVRAAVNYPMTDPAGRLFCYALTENLWIVGGAINNGGITLRWARDQLFAAEAEAARKLGEEPYEQLIELAQTAPPGAGGLLFLPLLTGERAPYWNANARGVFFGLSLQHERRHLLRAAMEGVMLQIRTVAQLLEPACGKAREVRASGGFARSAFWRQMLSDVLGTPVRVPQSFESSGIGAAWLGYHALGIEPDILGIHRWVKLDESMSHEPDATNHQLYSSMADLYDQVYIQLEGQFEQIVKLQQLSIK
jgi:gluconokinase